MRKARFRKASDLLKDNGVECLWVEVPKTHLNALKPSKWTTSHKKEFSGSGVRVGGLMNTQGYQTP